MIEISWVAIAGVCGLIMAALAIFGFWNKFAERISKCETAASAAATLATALQLKVDTIQKELSDYRVEAAGKFVSHPDLAHAETRFLDLVGEIRKDIRGVTERLDSVLAAK
jgi:hypothetical protein